MLRPLDQTPRALEWGWGINQKRRLNLSTNILWAVCMSIQLCRYNVEGIELFPQIWMLSTQVFARLLYACYVLLMLYRKSKTWESFQAQQYTCCAIGSRDRSLSIWVSNQLAVAALQCGQMNCNEVYRCSKRNLSRTVTQVMMQKQIK